MRRLLSALTVTAAVPVLIAVPVTSRPAASPHSVAPHVTTLAVPGLAAGHAAGHAAGLVADTGARHTARFDLVGATWPAGAMGPGSQLQVRVHQDGRWSDWSSLEAPDGGPDRGSADARRAAAVDHGTTAAEPLWVGAADGVEARVVTAGVRTAPAPDDVHVVLVDGGTSAADASPSPSLPLGTDVADAAVDRPTIYTRAQWGADESLRQRACGNSASYGSTVTMGFVHHTDNANSYSQSQVPSIIRSIYAYHVNSNGWCDIGYNFLVDRFGRIWEGRYGGITKPVIGAHTGGFNTNTFGASLIGDFTSTAPSAAMLTAVEKLFAWRLGTYYRDPTGKTTVTAGSFSGSRYRTGEQVTFNTISGHRDADLTSCPGGAAYSDLGAIRTAVRNAMGTGFVSPTLSTSTVKMASGSVSIAAGAVSAMSWTLTVSGSAGSVVRTVTGTAGRSTPVAAQWNLTDAAGKPVLPGTYTLRLSGQNAAGAAAVPFSSTVTVLPPVSLTVPTSTTLGRSVTVTGTGRRNRSVAVSVTSGGVVTDLGTRSVGSDGTWAAAAPVTASHDLVWSVTDPATGYVAHRTTRIGPAIMTPTSTSLVRAGAGVAVHGTALPDGGNTVTLMTRPAGATSATAGPSSAVAKDGSWTLTVSPASPTTYWVHDGRSLRSGTRLVYPVSAPSASAPTSGYARRSVRVSGNAGNAPAPVTLQARQGTASWTTVDTVTPPVSGRFAMTLPLPGGGGSNLAWRVTTGYGPAVTGSVAILATFPPTSTGPARVYWNSTHTVTGTAVPGDVVTVWTRPVGTSTWVRAGSTKTGSDQHWSFPLTVTRDIEWYAGSASGRSATIRTVVVPSIYGPPSATAGSAVVLHGRGIPGESLSLYRLPAAGGTWTAVKTATVGSDGTWSMTRHPKLSGSFRVTSHGQTSRAIAVSVS